MARIKRTTLADGTPYGVRFDCPGCNAPHAIPTKPRAGGWDFDENLDRPTLSPSILVYPHGKLADDGSVRQTPQCHSFVRNGLIQFLHDCGHELAGKTVELPEIPS